MLTFIIGLVTGAVVGIAIMCLIIMGKNTDRLEIDSASRPQPPG